MTLEQKIEKLESEILDWKFRANEISNIARDEVDRLKVLIKKSIWTIECLIEEYDDEDEDTIMLLKELKFEAYKS